MYSTPKSGKYVNATLDTIAKQLMEEGKLVKSEQNSNK
jgi:transcription termination factor NusB